ncbi:MAG: hypothetical protein WA840_20230 [Caulobacteraceae bacterium]
MTDRATFTLPPHVTREAVAQLLWDLQRDRLRGHKGVRVMPQWRSAEQHPAQRESFEHTADAVLEFIIQPARVYGASPPDRQVVVRLHQPTQPHND